MDKLSAGGSIDRFSGGKTLNRKKLSRQLPALVVILVGLLISAIVTPPRTPDRVPRQQIRDSIGASKFAFYQGARP